MAQRSRIPFNFHTLTIVAVYDNKVNENLYKWKVRLVHEIVELYKENMSFNGISEVSNNECIKVYVHLISKEA